jgi:tungstate transport system substrate-binding protein
MLIMHNDFVIVGPTDDPASVTDIESASQALKAISESGAPFVSRGDDSGTHKKEKSLWGESGVTPEGEWYIESGQGMGATLRIASEKLAYTLTDRATYLANRDTLDLAILVEGDPILLNVYHVITVNPEKWPKVNYQGALAFAEYLVSPEVQDTIGEFGVDKFGQPLFFPDAGKTDADLGNP